MKLMRSMKKLKSAVIMSVVLGIGANLAMPKEAQAGILLGLCFVPVGGPVAIGGLGLMGLDVFGYEAASPWMDDQQYHDSSFGKAMASLGNVGVGLMLLDRKLTTLPPLSEQDLSDNGYSREATARIVRDERDFDKKLAAERKAILITHGTSESSIRNGLIEFMRPEKVSDEFLDVFSKRLSLLAQRERDSRDPRTSTALIKPVDAQPGVGHSASEDQSSQRAD